MKTFFSTNEILSLPWIINPKPLRDRAGVYYITLKGDSKVLYVGQTSNLGYRLAPSVHPVFRRIIHDVHVLFEPDQNERFYLEAASIRLLSPVINKRFGLSSQIPSRITDEYYHAIFK